MLSESKISSNIDGMDDIELCRDSQLRKEIKEIINKCELINNTYYEKTFRKECIQ